MALKLSLKNKKVVVIGSGAKAVTIVPEIAEKVAYLTMLQRSPTYVGALPNKDVVAKAIKRCFQRNFQIGSSGLKMFF